MDLTAEVQRPSDMLPKGAAQKIGKASSVRVRLIPVDETCCTSWTVSSHSTSGISDASPRTDYVAMSSGTQKGSTVMGWISITGDMRPKPA